MNANHLDIFQYGASWLRADFHLHTKVDKEFSYPGDVNYYTSAYVDALVKANIRIGVITNHNKFDKDEFVALHKTAKNKDIYLLPGVELSVNDGANGIHILLVFSEQWLKNDSDYISIFLTKICPDTLQQFQNSNGRTDCNILKLVEEADKICRDGRDYFMVFAHVEDSKGLWEETHGGKLGDWKNASYATVRERTLGFQKVRSDYRRTQVKKWLGDWYPAEVEGSDPKSIEGIGKGEERYLKVGAFTFEAVKFALTDYANRVTKGVPATKHSNIESISFEGGTLDGETVRFSPELNTLIGIRGSGKSSILEVLRYVLEIPFGEKSIDQKYKQELVRYTMGSGGKVVIKARDRNRQPYEIRRILGDISSAVYIADILQPGVSIRETVLHKPILS